MVNRPIASKLRSHRVGRECWSYRCHASAACIDFWEGGGDQFAVFVRRITTCAALIWATASAQSALTNGPVAPSGFASVEGNSALSTPLTRAARTLQSAIAATSLTGLTNGAQIMGLSFRLDDSQSGPWPASDLTWTDYSIQLSTSLNAPGLLSTTFADNLGADVLTVRSGPLTVPAHSYSSGGLPNAFGPVITFDTPFTYHGGTLLITLRHSGNGVSERFVDANTDVSGSFQTIYSTVSDTATVANFGGRTPIFLLHFEIVPEPSAVTWLGGLAAAAFLRRRPGAE